MTDLSIDLGFMKLKNPVIAASGTFGYGIEFTPFIDLNHLGGFVVKVQRPHQCHRAARNRSQAVFRGNPSPPD